MKRKLTGLSNLLVGAQKRKKKKNRQMTLGISRVNWELPHVFEKAGPFTYNGEPRCPVTGYILGPEGSTNYAQ